VVGILLAAGAVIAAIQRGGVRWPWLLAAAGLVVLNDAMLTNLYGRLPDLIGGGWNWQGKALALVATLLVAALPAVGWRASGLTPRLSTERLGVALLGTVAYLGFFLAIALAFPGEPADAETIAFQLTMPGFEEEPFYRGLLLLVLGQAFVGRWRFLGADWHWGAVLSCMLFGLAHAFGYSDGAFGFDAVTMALTALPSFIAVWLVLLTRSVLLPVVLHNFGNAVTLLI